MKDTDKVTLTFAQLKRLIKESNESDFEIKDGILVKYNGPGGAVIIPDGVKKIGDRAFRGSEITSVKIPDSVTEIGEEAFSNCKELTSVVIPDSVTKIGDYAFYFTHSITHVSLPSSFECGEKIFDCADSLVIDSNDGRPFSEDVSSALFLFGIEGLIVTRWDYRCPKCVTWKGKELYYITDLGGKFSHYTIKKPLNAHFDPGYDISMFNRAKEANPKLFRKAMLQVLNNTKQTVWYDAVNDRWTSDEKMLNMRNRADAKRQRDLDMMNGL